MPIILLVDDDRAIIDVLRAALSRYTVVFATDGSGALNQLVEQHPDLVLLDLSMPVMDGSVLLHKIRATSNVPAIVLSARGEQQDVVQAFKAGADDFITKPFDLNDLEARVEAVLRRSTALSRPSALPPPDELHIGDLVLFRAGKTAVIRGRNINLTQTEFDLLDVLAQHPNEIMTRTSFAQEIWNYEGDDTHHLVSVHLDRMRIKLRQAMGAPRIITFRGKGIMLQTELAAI